MPKKFQIITRLGLVNVMGRIMTSQMSKSSSPEPATMLPYMAKGTLQMWIGSKIWGSGKRSGSSWWPCLITQVLKCREPFLVIIREGRSESCDIANFVDGGGDQKLSTAGCLQKPERQGSGFLPGTFRKECRPGIPWSEPSETLLWRTV